MINIDELTNGILNSNITLITTRISLKTKIIINLLNSLSICDNKKTRLFSFNVSSEFYMRKLISFLSGIDNRLLIKYFYPHLGIGKNNQEKIERNKFIEAIEKIQDSQIIMTSEKVFPKEDYLDYILENLETDVLIIDNITTLLKKTKYSFKRVLKRLNEDSLNNDHHIVLLINNFKTSDIDKIKKQFNGFVDNFVFIK